MKLYAVERIEQAEKKSEFTEWKTKIDIQRVKRAEKKAIRAEEERKRREPLIRDTLIYFENVPIKVEVIPHKELTRLAKKDYEKFQHERENWQADTYGADNKFIDRIKVNYIRHNLTDYDFLVEQASILEGSQEAIILIKKRVYSEIAKAYPALKKECENQLARREMESEFMSIYFK